MKKLYRLLPVILLLQFALPSSAQQTDDNTCDIDLSSNGDSLSMQKGRGYPVKIADSHYILYTNCKYVKIHKSNSVNNKSTITNDNGGFCYWTKDDGNVDTTKPVPNVSVPESDKIDWRCISFESDSIYVAQFSIDGEKLNLELNRKPQNDASQIKMSVVLSILQGTSGKTVDSTYTVSLDKPEIDFRMGADDTLQSIVLKTDEYIRFNAMTVSGTVNDANDNDNYFRKGISYQTHAGFCNDKKENSFPVLVNVSYISPDYEQVSQDIKILVNKVGKSDKGKKAANTSKGSNADNKQKSTKVENHQNSGSVLDKLLPLILGIAFLVVLFALLYLFLSSEKEKQFKSSKIQKDNANKAEEEPDIEKNLDYIEYSRMSSCLSDIERVLNLDNPDTIDNSTKWAGLVKAVAKQQEICTSKTALVESMKKESALHAEKMNELISKNNEKIENLNRQHAENLDSLKKELDEKSSLHTSEINELTSKFNEEIDNLNRQHAENLDSLKKELDKKSALHTDEMNELTSRHKEDIDILNRLHAERLNSLEKEHSDEIERIKKEHLDDLQDKEFRLNALNKETAYDKERFMDTVSALIHEISDLAASMDRNAVKGTFVYAHASRIVSSSNSLAVLEQKISEQADVSEQSLSSFINEVNTEIDRALNDSRSWINEAIRLYAYYSVPEIGRKLMTYGLSRDKITLFVHKAADLLLIFGYHLEKIPSLFVTIGDNAVYDKENMDTCIQNIYPDFAKLLTDNYIYDFFKIGYTKDHSKTRTTVTF